MEAYGSNAGQKEIGIGFILAALGLPSFVSVNKKTGKYKPSFGWMGVGNKGSGGVFGKGGAWQQMKVEEQLKDKLIKWANENPSAFEAIKVNFDNMVKQVGNHEKMEAAMAVDDVNGYKNSEHDAFFSFVYSRLRLGMYEDIAESIQAIEDMPLEEFKSAFEYLDLENMTDEEIQERKNDVVQKAIERASKISETYDNVNGMFASRINKTKKCIMLHLLQIILMKEKML